MRKIILILFASLIAFSSCSNQESNTELLSVSKAYWHERFEEEMTFKGLDYTINDEEVIYADNDLSVIEYNISCEGKNKANEKRYRNTSSVICIYLIEFSKPYIYIGTKDDFLEKEKFLLNNGVYTKKSRYMKIVTNA